jgi:hypothetical protein
MDEVLGPMDTAQTVYVIPVWIYSILDCIRFREVGIGVIYFAAQGGDVAYERKNSRFLLLVGRDQFQRFS